jgi:hypothetical protein
MTPAPEMVRLPTCDRVPVLLMSPTVLGTAKLRDPAFVKDVRDAEPV